MDFLVEVFLEIYMELMLLIVPEKSITKKHRILAKLLAVFVVLLVLALAVWGIVLLVDYDARIGILPLSIAIVLSLVQIVAGIILYKKRG